MHKFNAQRSSEPLVYLSKEKPYFLIMITNRASLLWWHNTCISLLIGDSAPVVRDPSLIVGFSLGLVLLVEIFLEGPVSICEFQYPYWREYFYRREVFVSLLFTVIRSSFREGSTLITSQLNLKGVYTHFIVWPILSFLPVTLSVETRRKDVLLWKRRS